MKHRNIPPQELEAIGKGIYDAVMGARPDNLHKSMGAAAVKALCIQRVLEVPVLESTEERIAMTDVLVKMTRDGAVLLRPEK